MAAADESGRLPLIKVRLPCADLDAFRKELKVITANGLRVAEASGRPPGSRIILLLELPGSTEVLTAEAKVAASPEDASGVLVRVLDWGAAPPSLRAHTAAAKASDPGKGSDPGAGSSPAQGKLRFEVSSPGSSSPGSTPPGSSSRSRAGSSHPGSPRPGTGKRPRPDLFLPAFEQLGAYQILRRLGGGGMAEVYLARQTLAEGIDKLVALKMVLPELVSDGKHAGMFLSEARVGATLQHGNVVQVHDFGDAIGRPFLAMEYVHGRDLLAWVVELKRRGKPAPVPFAVAVGLAVCRALEYVHEKRDLDGRPLNLVHRDVSPANVLVSAQGEVKLMDFGVAAAAGLEPVKTGQLVGKITYMSREQAQGLAPAPTWDLFSVGVLMHELLTLKRPYTVDQLYSPSFPDRQRPSWLNPSIPPALDGLIFATVDLDPEKRPASATQLRLALEQIQAQVGSSEVRAELLEMFGSAVSDEEREIERLMAEARRRAETRVPAALRPVVQAARKLRRRFLGTALGRAAARNPWAARGVVAAAVVGVLVAAGIVARISAGERTFVESLHRADAQAAAGRLVGAGGDRALDQLLTAGARRPDDPRLLARRTALGTKLEALADLAVARGDDDEAAAQLAAALQADPGRPSAQEKLAAVEERTKARSRGKVSRTKR